MLSGVIDLKRKNVVVGNNVKLLRFYRKFSDEGTKFLHN